MTERAAQIKEFGSQILVTHKLLNAQTEQIRQNITKQLLHAGAQWLAENGANAVNTQVEDDVSDPSIRGVEFYLYGEAISEVTLAAVLTMLAEQNKNLTRRAEQYTDNLARHDRLMGDQLRKVAQANQRGLFSTVWLKLRGKSLVEWYEEEEY